MIVYQYKYCIQIKYIIATSPNIQPMHLGTVYSSCSLLFYAWGFLKLEEPWFVWKHSLKTLMCRETMHISIQTGTLNKHEQGHQLYEKINHICMQQTFVQKRDNMFIFLVFSCFFRKAHVQIQRQRNVLASSCNPNVCDRQ